ncbi:hypothetical protein GE21DRAFT_9791 [Neurospora crassa]|uniref:Uncharacterized protein n=1 Tax=Neurospora crassa (strain ATCC 24698 / 74-OR23-1A / CBS 708.71 / DSM 1257 / FGSC 987) TaxID=367110 RepID=V5IKB9_NEUCR|nr:hypothetical protein NCU17170 [Neurospora crassa OR74A]ESA41828.1 hypothetical protein NCU17170 [Neurospora crassa OR74A]KHE82562.1 hypothetical protein GE21DRAFT_9791 [Neurospora crassa]|eukprot:XP_011395349.1 hypothetical protein NCU17170 [Neurospora crassa OR74A]
MQWNRNSIAKASAPRTHSAAPSIHRRPGSAAPSSPCPTGSRCLRPAPTLRPPPLTPAALWSRPPPPQARARSRNTSSNGGRRRLTQRGRSACARCHNDGKRCDIAFPLTKRTVADYLVGGGKCRLFFKTTNQSQKDQDRQGSRHGRQTHLLGPLLKVEGSNAATTAAS